eukprot:3925698-Ditylum_brightwellii.AAC.1
MVIQAIMLMIVPRIKEQATQVDIEVPITSCLGYNSVKKQQDDVISSSWILLDTCSTGSVSNNQSLVRNIQPCSEDDKL